MEYIAYLHKDRDSDYGVSFPDVPGCISAGDTFEEAVANAAEALAGHFALMKSDGDPIPASASTSSAPASLWKSRVAGTSSACTNFRWSSFARLKG